MKKVLSLLILSGLAAAQQKLVCIDSTKIMNESKLVQQKRSTLMSKAQEYQRQLDEINKKLEDLKKQIESKAISQQIKEQKIKEYQQTEAKGLELQNRANKELAELRTKLEEELFASVKKISQDIAKQQGYTGILDCNAFVYIDPQLDISKEVITRLDQGK